MYPDGIPIIQSLCTSVPSREHSRKKVMWMWMCKKAQSCKVGITSRTCSRCWCSERGWRQFKACTGFEGLLLKILVYDGSLGNASFSVKEGKDLSEIFRNWRMTAVREWKSCEDNAQDLQCIEILSDKFEQEKHRDTVMKRAHRRIAWQMRLFGARRTRGKNCLGFPDDVQIPNSKSSKRQTYQTSYISLLCFKMFWWFCS